MPPLPPRGTFNLPSLVLLAPSIRSERFIFAYLSFPAMLFRTTPPHLHSRGLSPALLSFPLSPQLTRKDLLSPSSRVLPCPRPPKNSRLLSHSRVQQHFSLLLLRIALTLSISVLSDRRNFGFSIHVLIVSPARLFTDSTGAFTFIPCPARTS